ncbi:hypothetical protein PHLCEN_2v9861 [Hermanssonia centrifuga]|uniref:Uncharacterized protein n=1 Tax=Hermanssonia centrifuga TaxID=98765 RepID=A0A2R6NQG4_9APHY|nr:hypothetical protein PHLCEN_2v9861 [Hermanssonia centrifuga]
MDHFSWADSVQAIFGPCLACWGSRPKDNEDDEEHGPAFVPRARSDELEGLLASTDDADDLGDAETLSLHSNIGDRDRRRRKHRQPRKGIRVFGFDLFGRPPIHLPEEEEEDTGISHRRIRTISASTLDSDAAPLDPSTIDELSVAHLTESIVQREEERRRREEKRRRRKEKKERARLALAMALERGEAEFEGFQGSGPTSGYPQSTFHTTGTESLDTPSTSTHDDFGPFEQGRRDMDVDHADFGAEPYTPSRRERGVNGSSGTGSDSRSRTSASVSSPDPSQYNHHYTSQAPPPDRPQRKKRRSSRHSTSSASQSISIPSPVPQQTSFPAIAEHEQGLPLQRSETLPAEFGINDPTDDSANGFPIVGLRGVPRRKSSQATSGAFLARRGDD